ncbi:MAG TPA: HlyD family secretion protein [Gemmatimonadaceae bacterium]|nr:HlyD family secretion protein [Gemmatimonadaceae bacterium]
MATTAERESKAARSGETREFRSTQAPRKRHIALGVGVVITVLGLIWGFQKYMYGRSHVSTDDAAVDGHIIPVVAKVGGYVAKVNVAENDQVKEGQILAQLDTAELAVKLAQADADLAAARASAGGGGQAEAQVQIATGQRGAMVAQIGAAQANLNRARDNFNRMQELAAKQIVSQQTLNSARGQLEAATAELAAAQRTAAAASGTVSGAQAGTRVATARLEAMQAARANAELQLSYTRIAAPASGSVSRKTVEVGQLVQPAQQMMSIVADTGAFITANFKETQLAKMKVGQHVDIDIDAYKGCQVTGRVQSISGATGSKFSLLPPDNATGNFTKVVQRIPVRIAVAKECGANRPLRPGMSVSAHVNTAQ